MAPVTFNPGPSQVSQETLRDMESAMREGVLTMSHRSTHFRTISELAVRGLRTFFGIPQDYAVFYTSSATEAMELTIRNLVRTTSFHYVHGSFSKLFADVSARLYKQAIRDEAPWGQGNRYTAVHAPAEAELICMTYNETSTGVMCTNADVAAVRAAHPHMLLAVDITSIAAMQQLNIADADIWVCSVQKGFGLPSGLGLMFVSPRAVAKAKELEQDGTNLAGTFTFSAMQECMEKGFQTICTPNTLNIYLLGKQLVRWNQSGGLAEQEKRTREKAQMVSAFVEHHPALNFYVQDASQRSTSVLCIQADPHRIAAMHEAAKAEGITLGSGYGKLKTDTFRIANFPAIQPADIWKLTTVLERVVSTDKVGVR